MSVIQNIQEKYAKLMAVIIAVALIIFVVMLAFENGGSLFRSGDSTVVGKINGESIEFASLETKIKQQEDANKQQGYPSEMAREQAIEQVWSREVGRIVLETEAKKLGMQIGKKEMGDILYGANPPEDLKRSFTDPATGVYNAAQAKQQIDMMLKSKTTPKEQKAQFNTYLNYLELLRINDKYNALLLNSTNFPKWFVEKQNADNSQIANVSLARQLYSSIPDSVVKVTDKEIGDYVEKHKSMFPQSESRGISYVAFSALPTAADSSAARETLQKMIPGLDSASDVQSYMESQGNDRFYNGYISGARIQVPSKESIISQPTGSIYGPYVDGGSYSVAKLLGSRVQPDSVTVRHILIATAQQDQSGAMTPVRDSASARHLIDSIRTAINTGSNFDSVCAKLSEDPGSKDNGGKYENMVSGPPLDAAFNEYIFGNPVGSKGIVKSVFGYHYIEILSAKGSSTAYKIAYLSVPIEASNETDGAASNEASQFASNSRDRKSFDANAEKLQAKGINKAFAQDITPTASQIMGLGSSRSFVKAIYEAKLGDVVLSPSKVGDSYVVAVVTEVNEKGTASVSKARMMVEPLLRNKKKGEEISKKLGNITSLEAAAAAMGNVQIETADSVHLSGNPPSPLIGSEPKVLGAAFNPANKGKVSPAIPGSNGVYVIRVNNVSATALADANVTDQRQQRYLQVKMRGAGTYQQALILAADIKDNRAKFY